MASFIYEEGTQAQASAFQAGDTLLFKTAVPTNLGVAYAGQQGLNAATVTLSFGTESLTFAASALTDSSTKLQFLGSAGTLTIGTPGADSALAVSSTADSSIYGLDGNDTVAVSGSGNHLVDGGAGNDIVSVTATTTVGGNYFLEGGLGSDTIDASNSHGNLHIYGGALGNSANATDGDDIITLNHGTASSTVTGAFSVTDYVNGNGGNDTISVSTGGGAGDLYRLQGGGGNDLIVGGTGTNSINGNLGDDTVVGHGTNDWLRGGQGNDLVVAGLNGNTQLFGDLGNDTLVAGNGINVLTGGAGNDVFDFHSSSATAAGQPGASIDTVHAGYFSEITDFTSGSDKIDLTGVTTATSANILLQSGSTFTTEAAAQNYAQTLLTSTTAPSGTHNVALIQVGTDTYLFANEHGGGSSIDTVIKLDSVTAANVKSTDFI